MVCSYVVWNIQCVGGIVHVWVRYGTWTCWGAMRIRTHRGIQEWPTSTLQKQSCLFRSRNLKDPPVFLLSPYLSKVLAIQIIISTNQYVGLMKDRKWEDWGPKSKPLVPRSVQRTSLLHVSVGYRMGSEPEGRTGSPVWRTAKDFWLHGYFRPHSATPADLEDAWLTLGCWLSSINRSFRYLQDS